ncbi:MAG: PspC domain-containing protein [Peptococcaceae bacterium]|nr:PspC domain-containing protein [Peptococcaceae bacterium]
MEKRLYRSRSSRMLGGVCGGIAEYANADPTVIRLLVLLMVLAMGSGLLFYIAAWVIMPEGPQSA